MDYASLNREVSLNLEKMESAKWRLIIFQIDPV